MPMLQRNASQRKSLKRKRDCLFKQVHVHANAANGRDVPLVAVCLLAWGCLTAADVTITYTSASAKKGGFPWLPLRRRLTPQKGRSHPQKTGWIGPFGICNSCAVPGLCLTAKASAQQWTLLKPWPEADAKFSPPPLPQAARVCSGGDVAHCMHAKLWCRPTGNVLKK